MFLLLTLVLATAKLPLIDVPATRGSSDTLVVFVSGDGGWAKIDKAVSGVLANEGMPVVGLNALQYFWTKRTPEIGVARPRVDHRHQPRALEEIERRPRRLLARRRRPARDGRAAHAGTAVEDPARSRSSAPSPHVEFEFHVADWMHDSKRGLPVEPELAKLTDEDDLRLGR